MECAVPPCVDSPVDDRPATARGALACRGRESGAGALMGMRACMGVSGLWRGACKSIGGWQRVRDWFRRFVNDDSGVEVVEWAVITLLMALAGYVVLTVARQYMGTAYDRILDQFLR